MGIDRRLRILMVTPDFPPRPGGVQLLAHRLATHFQRAEVRVHTLEAPGARGWDATQPVDVRRISTTGSHRAAVLRLDAAAVLEARRFRPDVVLAMHIAMAPACAAIRCTLRTPVVTYMHAREVSASPRLARWAVRTSARIVAVSRYTAGLATAAGAEPERIRVIPPGVDWKEPSSAPRLSRSTVVTVARLADSYKGHDVMVRAMPLIRSQVPDAQWIVIGDGTLLPHIERLASVGGVSDAIRFCGAVSDDERDYWLSRAHVFAMPSRVPPDGRGGEGFGIVYLEAGVHGLPVVAGRAGGARDAVLDGQTGLLVDAGDHVQVAAAISRLLLHPDPAARMGAAGRARAHGFAWPAIARRVETLMAETAGAA